MEKLRPNRKRFIIIATFFISVVVIFTGIILKENILTEIGGALLIVPIYFVFDYILAVIRNQYKIKDEIVTSITALEKSIKRLETNSAKNKEQLEKNTNALFSVFSYLDKIEAPLPLMMGYAIDPEGALALLDKITETKPENYLDLGSGLSTILAGYAIKKMNHGHVWSVEHDPGFYQISADLIRKHGLEPYVTLIHAPLKEYEIGEKKWLWYDLSLFPDNKSYDLVLVDGPPGTTQEMARYPALPLLKDRINAHAVVLVDDAAREDEKRILDRWMNEFPEIRVTMATAKKGFAILSF